MRREEGGRRRSEEEEKERREGKGRRKKRGRKKREEKNGERRADPGWEEPVRQHPTAPILPSFGRGFQQQVFLCCIHFEDYTRSVYVCVYVGVIITLR